VNARIVAPIALLALALPAPAMAQDGSGGTGVPAGGNGGVRSVPGRTAAPPVPQSADAGPAPTPPAAPGVPRPPHPQPTRLVAHPGQSNGGDVVDVPVPRHRSKAAAPAVPAAVPAARLPMTGFDLGLLTAVGLLMTAAGLLLSAAVGPRPHAPRPARRRPA
jgi:hypothetical protein